MKRVTSSESRLSLRESSAVCESVAKRSFARVRSQAELGNEGEPGEEKESQDA